VGISITLGINNLTSPVRNDLENENFLNGAYVRPVALTIWLLHDKVLLNVIPRLTAFTSWLIGVWFIYNFWSEIVEIGFLPITKHFDFLGFIPKPFSFAHFSTSDKILLLIRTQACISVTGLLTYIWTSSAYKCTSLSDMILGRSLTYTEEKKLASQRRLLDTYSLNTT